MGQAWVRGLGVSVVALVAATRAGSGGDALRPAIEVTRVSHRVVVLRALRVNVTAIATSGGVILVDTNRSPGVMEALRRRAAVELGRDDVRWVINTHCHWDHASGNQLFTDATIIGHQLCADFMRSVPATADHTRWGLSLDVVREQETEAGRALVAAGPGRPPAAGSWARVAWDLDNAYVCSPPSVAVEEGRALDLGGTTVKLYHCGHAHTNHDLFVEVPAEGVLLTGDVFCGPESVCGQLDDMVDGPRLVALIDELLAERPGAYTVIPGHGDPFPAGELEALRASIVKRYAGRDPARSEVRKLLRAVESDGAAKALPCFEHLREVGHAERPTERELDRVAWVLSWQGRSADALAVLRWSSVVYPESVLLQGSLAETLLLAGERAQAAVELRRMLELSPAHPFASHMLAELQQ